MFFLALTTLRDAAETSPLVRRCGRHLVAQPPGRRYAALTAGGHIFGITLSYGAIELLAAMVMRANTLESAGGSTDIQAIRTRRMLLAIYRGFCVMNCWSPINIMTAVVSTAVPAAPMRLLLPLAFVVAVGMTALGWIEDRLSGARLQTRGGPRPTTSESWMIHWRIVALILLVMALAEGTAALFGISLVTGVTLVVPLIAIGWLERTVLAFRRAWRAVVARPAAPPGPTLPAARADNSQRGDGARCLRFHGRGNRQSLAGHRPDTVACRIAPHNDPATDPASADCHRPAGLNPVAVVALVGAVIPHPVSFGVPPAVLAFACMLGWGLGVTMTPMSSSAIITARWAGVSPWTVTTRWNAAFTASALLLAWAAIAAAFVAWQ